MSEILLINPPMWTPTAQSDFSSLSPPLGLAYLAAALQTKGADVSILDCSVERDLDQVLEKALADRALKMVGLTTLTQNYHIAMDLARRIKALNPKVTLVVGGPHVTYRWKEALAETAIDVVVLFEGEHTVVELYEQLHKARPNLHAVKGLAFRDKGESVRTESRPAETNLDNFAIPARQLLHMERYGRPGTVITSRGCPEKCIFCISSIYEGAYRMRGAQSVVDEIEAMVRRWGMREFYFLDNVFTVDTDRVFKICDMLVERNLNILFNCVSRANLVTVPLVRRMKQAGCIRMEIGVESGVQQNIDTMGKNIKLEHVLNAVEVVVGEGVIPMFTFQLGSPFDTPEMLQQTQDLAQHLRSRGATTFFSIMTPYPGTPIGDKPEEFGIKIRTNDWKEFRTSNPVCDSAFLTRNDIRTALFNESVRQVNEAMSRQYPFIV